MKDILGTALSGIGASNRQRIRVNRNPCHRPARPTEARQETNAVHKYKLYFALCFERQNVPSGRLLSKCMNTDQTAKPPPAFPLPLH